MLREIADIQLNHVRELLAKRGVTMVVTEAATDMLIAEGYDPVYGARPLKRAFQRLVENPLANALLERGFSRDSIIEGSWLDGELQLTERPVADKAIA